jgi:hypothetical protein
MTGAAPSSRGGSWRPILLLVVVAPLLLGLVMLLRDGGGLQVVPAMDWSPFPESVHDAVDLAAKNGNCAGLAEQRAWAVGAEATPLVAYIDSIRQSLVCLR